MKKTFLFTLLCCLFTLSATAMTIDRIVAKVGSEVITLSDLKQEGAERKAYLIHTQGPQKGAEAFARFSKNLLDELVLEKILESEISKNSIEISDAQVEQELQAQRNRKQLDEKAFGEALSRSGLTLAEYKKRLRLDLEKQMFIQKKIAPLINVSEYDLQQEYQKNILNYQTYRKLRFIEAFLTIDTFPDQQKMLETANNIQAALKAGQTPAQLIKKHSSGAFAQNGGDSGLVESSSLRPEVLSILDSLKNGETSEQLTFPGGILVFKLISKAEPQPLPFNQVVNQVRMRYFESIVDSELKKYLLSVKDKTYVEILSR